MTVGFGQGAVSVSLPPECSADRSSSTVASHHSADANSLTSAELGLGGKVPFSAAKPTRLTALDECEVIEYVSVMIVEARLMCSIGAAAWFTIFIVKSVEVTSYKENTLGALPIWPTEVESASTCIACFEDRGEPDPIMCEKVCPLHSPMRQPDV
jgi:hypothetical protein